MQSFINYMANAQTRHNVFISYHHKNDQYYKERLLTLNTAHKIFIDKSVDSSEIDDDLPDESIRRIIRNDFLSDSSVTILLVGTETQRRKHIDWEIYSSMYDGAVNKKSGILVINLPSINCSCYTATHSGEKERIYPETTDWCSITSREEYESRYPYMPGRIIDNLLVKGMKISVVPWSKIEGCPQNLRFLVDAAHADRTSCEYDLSTPMRRANS